MHRVPSTSPGFHMSPPGRPPRAAPDRLGLGRVQVAVLDHSEHGQEHRSPARSPSRSRASASSQAPGRLARVLVVVIDAGYGARDDKDKQTHPPDRPNQLVNNLLGHNRVVRRRRIQRPAPADDPRITRSTTITWRPASKESLQQFRGPQQTGPPGRRPSDGSPDPSGQAHADLPGDALGETSGHLPVRPSPSKACSTMTMASLISRDRQPPQPRGEQVDEQIIRRQLT